MSRPVAPDLVWFHLTQSSCNDVFPRNVVLRAIGTFFWLRELYYASYLIETSLNGQHTEHTLMFQWTLSPSRQKRTLKSENALSEAWSLSHSSALNISYTSPGYVLKPLSRPFLTPTRYSPTCGGMTNLPWATQSIAVQSIDGNDETLGSFA